MILVTGGCFQGKTEYALEKFQISRDEAADGRTCPLHMIYTTKLLYHFHEYIRRLMKEEQELSVEELLQVKGIGEKILAGLRDHVCI